MPDKTPGKHTQGDSAIFGALLRELDRQRRGLELIASENFTSWQVLRVMGSWLTNKYAEGLPRKRYYGGCQHIDEVEELAIERVKRLFNANWANVQPHSGAQANMAVMYAVLEPGDTILGLGLPHGGHLTHGAPVNFSGRYYRAIHYGLDEETGYINYDQVEELAHIHKPKLIVCGASAYSRDWDYARLRQIADAVNAILMADIAHPAGLIAAGLLKNPFPYCHIVTSTTHKTLRGPRGGFILMQEDFPNPRGLTTASGKIRKMSSVLDSAVFPGVQGGPLEHVIAGKAVAFWEALQPSFKEYAKQVIANAQTMARLFQEKGYRIVSGGTDTHLFLVDLRNKGITGKEAEETLEKVDITVNKNMIPGDPNPPRITSGIRIGTAAITTRGIRQEHLPQIVEWIDEALRYRDNDQKLKQIRKAVNQFMSQFPLYPEVEEDPWWQQAFAQIPSGELSD